MGLYIYTGLGQRSYHQNSATDPNGPNPSYTSSKRSTRSDSILPGVDFSSKKTKFLAAELRFLRRKLDSEEPRLSRAEAEPSASAPRGEPMLGLGLGSASAPQNQVSFEGNSIPGRRHEFSSKKA